MGGLLNATCGNATELIIALFALMEGKIEVVKCSLLGSVLSNLLLVLGSSLFCGGVVNLGSDQLYDRVRTNYAHANVVHDMCMQVATQDSEEEEDDDMFMLVQTQADVSTGLLILGVLCQSLPLMLRYAVSAGEHSVAADTTGLDLSRACSIVMLLAYVAYLFFQLKTHAQLFEPQDAADDDGEAEEDEQAVIGFASGLFWLAFKTVLIAILSEYVVGTIEVQFIYYINHSFPLFFLKICLMIGTNVTHALYVLPAYLQILGFVCQLHQHHPATNRRERRGACRGHHFCSQEQTGRTHPTQPRLFLLSHMFMYRSRP